MLAYRIVHKLFGKNFTASGLPGRWNGPGKRVIYCAESIALAFLENMVRRQGVGFNDDFCTMIIDIPDSLKMFTIKEDKLEDGWKNFHDYSICQALGNSWYQDNKYPVLKVPSAVLPSSYNLVINTTHKDFSKLRIVQITSLIPDARIENILKKS